ncbi:MAG: hypothetical protein JXB23_10055 [Candidatus Aminicenantes bacterium]|nr:hypothetical protein [Candidatus Aminicenantes bacterium]
MVDFLEIKCLSEQEQKKVMQELEQIISEKKNEGVFTEKEIREIVELKLVPLPDILDVQSVYESILYAKKSQT